MSYKYYHGTSSIFLASIAEFGLGGINPNIKYKNLELLKYLSDQGEIHLTTNIEYLKSREPILAMARQTDLEIDIPNGDNIFLNYRHDGIYVAFTRERAAIYACTNRYGSEILDYCIKLYKLLKIELKGFMLPEDLNLFGIEKYLDYEQKPILVEAIGVKDGDLETENGREASHILNELRAIIPNLSKKEKFEKLQFINFKILKPIPPERLKFYEIEYYSHPKYLDFEWTMTEIELDSNIFNRNTTPSNF